MSPAPRRSWPIRAVPTDSRMDMHAIEVTGTLTGHALIGAFLTGWALLWLVEDVMGVRRGVGVPLEAGSVMPWLKVVLPLGVSWFEVPNSGWVPAHALQGWQHITMYAAFALGGGVDLLVRRGRLGWRASYVAYGAALLNAGILFIAHGAHGGVPGAAHILLAILFLGAAAVAFLELAFPEGGVERYRIASLLATGGWLLTISWILYLSGWEMSDPLRVGYTYLLFSLNGIGVGVILLVAALFDRRVGRAAAERDRAAVGAGSTR